MKFFTDMVPLKAPKKIIHQKDNRKSLGGDLGRAGDAVVSADTQG